MDFSYIYSIYCNCKIEVRAERVATLHRRASENQRIEPPSRPCPRPRDAASQCIRVPDRSRARFPLRVPSSSHQHTLRGRTHEKEQTRMGILPQEPIPGLGDLQLPGPGLQGQDPKRSPSASAPLLRSLENPGIAASHPQPRALLLPNGMQISFTVLFRCWCHFHSTGPAHCFHHRHRLALALSGR